MHRRMKTVTISLLFLVLVISVESLPLSQYYSERHLVENKRGFKNRHSYGHGYGKRTSETIADTEEEGDTSDRSVDNGALAEILANFPAMTKVIVSDLIDLNGDGKVSESEFRTVFLALNDKEDSERTPKQWGLFGERG